MVSTEKEWPLLNGRVEFHLNGGITKVSLWIGGLQEVDIPTDQIPTELRRIGTWLSLRCDSTKWLEVEGPGEPEPRYEEWLRKRKDL